MKGNLKRNIISVVSAVSVLASSLTFTALAETNSIKKVYADIKGLDIVFENAVTSADYATLAFEKLGGDAVDYTTAVEDKILHLHFDEDIETGTNYKLTIGDKEKSVTVNKLFFEDFEGDYTTVSSSKVEGYDETGKKWGLSGSFAIVGDSSKHGGTSKKGIFKDGTFVVNETLGTVEKTVTADVMVYNGATWNGSLSSKSTDNNVKVCVAGGTANYVSSYAMNIYKDTVDVGVYDQSNRVDGNGYHMIKSTLKTFKPAAGLAIGSATAPSVNLETGYSNDDWKTANYTIDTVASEHEYTARTYNNVISGYFENDYVGTGFDRVTPSERFSETDRTSNVNAIYLERFSINPNWPGMVAVDNVLVTTCTVADIVPNSVTKVYADTKGMDIVFENAVVGSDYYDLSFVGMDGEAVEYNTETEGNILHLHFKEDIDTGVEYKLIVDGESKAVTVNEIFFEDFEDNALSTRADAGSIKAKDRNGIDWTANQGNKFCAILDGAKYGDSGHWLAITDGPFCMNKNAGTADMSINADVMMYNGERRNNDNTGWVGYKTPTGQMFVRGAAYQESYTMKIANVGKNVQVGATSYKGTGNYGLIDGFKSIKTDITFGSITAPSVRAENPSNEDWAAMTYTIDSLAKPYNYTARGYADTAAAYFENQYVGTYIDTVSGRFTDQRAGVQSNAAGTMLVDNVLVTTCTVEDIKELEVTGVYADTAHVEIQFNEEISGEVADISGISLKKYATDEVVALSVADFVAYGNTIRINKAIDRDTLYEVSLKKGFGTTVNTASADFSEIFTVKTLWYEDFETGTGADLVNTKIRLQSNNVKAYPVIKDGKLYSYSGFAPMADELKVYENATFTATTLLYKNLGHGDFATNYNKTIPYSYVAFNAKQPSINEKTDLRWSSENYAVRQFGWYLMNAGQRRYHNWVDDLVVVTPAEGTDYKAGDIVSDKLSRGYGLNSPSAQTGTVDGIGTVDFGQHYANTTHKAITVGDAHFNSSAGEITVYKKGDALPGTYKKSNGTEVTVSECEAVPFEMTIEKQGSTGTLVFDGVPADTYKTAEEDMKKGYFGFATQGIEIFGFEDMLITAYVKTNTVKEVTLDYADKYGVVIEGLTGEIPANFDGITIYDLNEKENVEIKGGKSVDDSLFVEADLELNKPYKVTVKSKTAVGDDMYAGADYSEVFMVKEVLKVEPTVASIKQLNSGIGGPVANKIVQGDGFVALFGMTLKTPNYYNATIEAEIGYYADVPGGSPYIVNYFNHAGKNISYTNSLGTEETTVGGFRLYISGSNNIRVNAANVIAEDEEYNESNVPFFKTNIPSGIYFGEYGCARHADPNNGSASSAWDGSIKKEIAPHTERYVMADDAYRMYVDNNPILSYKGNMNDSGYVQFGGSSRGLTKLYGVTVTQMEIIDKIALNVEDITADAKEIKVLFDQNVQGASDFSKVEVLEDGVKVNATFTTDEKELNIVPEGGIKSGAVYSVTVASGFGPSEICYTSEAASKNFKVTVYANADFTDGADDDLIFDGVVNYKDGEALFTNGSMVINNDDMASAKKYIVKYDYKQYTALEVGGQYNNSPTVSKWFNRADTESANISGFYWNVDSKTVAMSGNEKLGEATGNTYGDAVVVDNDINIVQKGESLVEYFISNGDDIIPESERSATAYEYEIQKVGAGASLTKDGTLVHTFTGTEAENASEKGYFGIEASATAVVAIDNIQAYTFEEITGIEIDIDVTSGKAIITNYSDEAFNTIVVVAAYSNTNGMLSCFKSLPLEAKPGVTEVPFTLENTAGVKTYKAFAWDNLTDLIPYCEAAIYEVE